MTEAQFELTKYIPHLTLMGKLWDKFCEDFGESWLCYDGIAQ